MATKTVCPGQGGVALVSVSTSQLVVACIIFSISVLGVAYGHVTLGEEGMVSGKRRVACLSVQKTGVWPRFLSVSCLSFQGEESWLSCSHAQ